MYQLTRTIGANLKADATEYLRELARVQTEIDKLKPDPIPLYEAPLLSAKGWINSVAEYDFYNPLMAEYEAKQHIYVPVTKVVRAYTLEDLHKPVDTTVPPEFTQYVFERAVDNLNRTLWEVPNPNVWGYSTCVRNYASSSVQDFQHWANEMYGAFRDDSQLRHPSNNFFSIEEIARCLAVPPDVFNSEGGTYVPNQGMYFRPNTEVYHHTLSESLLWDELDWIEDDPWPEYDPKDEINLDNLRKACNDGAAEADGQRKNTIRFNGEGGFSCQ
jgi:hypothetical protein